MAWEFSRLPTRQRQSNRAEEILGTQVNPRNTDQDGTVVRVRLVLVAEKISEAKRHASRQRKGGAVTSRASFR
jgi:hypothetical protein